MNGRALIGIFLAALLMFVVGFLGWATPAKYLGFSTADAAKLATVQQALAANLPRTGRYTIPNPDDPTGAPGYIAGPIATVDFNRAGYAPIDPATLIKGFGHYLIVAAILAAALRVLVRHVALPTHRIGIAFGLTGATAVLTLFSDPIYDHHDWRFAAYAFAIYLLMLWPACFVLLRWFLVPGKR